MAETPTPPSTDETTETEPMASGSATDASAGEPAAYSAREATVGGAPGGASAGHTEQNGSGAGFFAWLRALRVPRQPGWIGGVCAGIAARLGIDPIIVRGVIVVFAIFAAPAFLLYGLAWLLLPDASGRIHLQSLIRGVFDSAIVGIAIFALVGLFSGAFGGGLVPRITSGFWLPGFFGGHSLFAFLWWVILAIGATALVVWLVRKSSQTPTSGYGSEPAATPTAQATPATATAVAADSSVDSEPTAGPVPAPADNHEPIAPEQPTTVTSTDEYADWKLRYDAWRVEHEQWKRAQADADRSARASLAAENKARAAEFAVEAQEARRIRKLTRPRTSFAYVVAAIGLALVAGALAAVFALDRATRVDVATAAFAAATIVTGLSMVLAGVIRRRSGFLAFVTICLLAVTMGLAAVPRHSQLIWFSGAANITHSASYTVPLGSLSLDVDGDAIPEGSPLRVSVEQGAGNVSISAYHGARVHVDAEYGSGWATASTISADGTWTDVPVKQSVDSGKQHFTTVVTPDDVDVTADVYVTITGGNGGVSVQYQDDQDDQTSQEGN